MQTFSSSVSDSVSPIRTYFFLSQFYFWFLPLVGDGPSLGTVSDSQGYSHLEIGLMSILMVTKCWHPTSGVGWETVPSVEEGLCDGGVPGRSLLSVVLPREWVLVVCFYNDGFQLFLERHIAPV